MLTTSRSPQLESNDSKSHTQALYSPSPRPRRENAKSGFPVASSPIVKPYSTHVYSDTQRISPHRSQPTSQCTPVTPTVTLGTTNDRSTITSVHASLPNSTRSIATQTLSPTPQPQVHPSMVDAATQYSPPTTAISTSNSASDLVAQQRDQSIVPAANSTPTTQIGNLHLFDTSTNPLPPTRSDLVADAAAPIGAAGSTSKTSEPNSMRESGKKTRVGSTSAPSKRNHAVAEAESQNQESEVIGSSGNTAQELQKTVAAAVENAVASENDSPSSKRARPESPPVRVMPRLYEHASTRDLVVLISSMLMELIRYNDAIPLGSQGQNLTRFHSRAPPGISVLDYLQRLTTHATLSPPILLSMVYYIDKLCALYPVFTISSLTVHRFLITSATVASKGLSDSFWTNKTYAKVGGVSMKELALLELEFLVRVQWRIVPQPEVLVDYYRSLVERSPGYMMEALEHRQTPDEEPG